jgi:metal-responsive CopG/Arc/MetJ family transcriptional regulator
MADLYRTQILLERRQHQDLSDLAKAEGRSMSEMVREAVAEYLVERREESRRLDWNERLAELAKIREAIRAESGEFLEEFILNDRAEREEELAQKVWGGE